MVETIQGNGFWHVTLAERDLVKQAGLRQEDFEQDFGFFKYKNRPVIMSHIFDEHLVVSMEGDEDYDMKALMDGFSSVVGYQPFCRYTLNTSNGSKSPPLLTYEWDKVDPDTRYKELSVKETTSGLTRLL